MGIYRDSTFSLSPSESVFMRRAFRLALRGTGRTSPNPLVGAVVVRDGRVAGTGFHVYQDTWHAERVALQQAGPAARGADLYVTLEPCSHQGRTPPCTGAVLAAGISSVRAGMLDPNPLVAGRGLEQLRQAGVMVELSSDPFPFRYLNRAFAHFITRRRPWVLLKAALTLDGRIASASGQSKWITGPQARMHGHWLRYQADAILAGIQTVLADDPELSCRYRRERTRPLVRAVLDPHLKIPTASRLVQTARQWPLLVFTASPAAPEKAAPLQAAGAEVVELPPGPDGLSLDALLDFLGSRRIMSLLVEGGAATATAFLRQGLAHEAAWFFAPRLLGGDARPVCGNLGALAPGDGPGLRITKIRLLSPDFLVEGLFRTPETAFLLPGPPPE